MLRSNCKLDSKFFTLHLRILLKNISLLCAVLGQLWLHIYKYKNNFINIYNHHHHHHHHHVVRLARISQALFLHVPLAFIASGRSSELHPVSSHSCCMNVRAGRPAFDWPYAGVHRSTSLTISSLLLQQCPACLVHLPCIVFMIGGR